MKKAYNVTFSITTRVEVDVPEGFDPNNVNLLNKEQALPYDNLLEKATNNILETPDYYLYYGTVESIEEDEDI